jgi:hypothetical protein
VSEANAAWWQRDSKTNAGIFNRMQLRLPFQALAGINIAFKSLTSSMDTAVIAG